MKNLLLLMCLTANTIFAQDAKKEAEKFTTKMDQLSAKTGVIIKYIEYKLPVFKSTYGLVPTRIRKVFSGTSAPAYFYQLEKEGKYTTNTASIEYSDLLEVLKAINILKESAPADLLLNPSYLENKFISNDGFLFGYYVSDSKITWYMKLERYGSDASVYFTDVNIAESAFVEAKNKIEELKKQ